jgi:fructosamine-3-kinase
LHNIRDENYGMERDTLIGALRQPNTQSRDWPAFFGEHRLIYMGNEALKEKKIDAKTMKQIEKLAGASQRRRSPMLKLLVARERASKRRERPVPDFVFSTSTRSLLVAA